MSASAVPAEAPRPDTGKRELLLDAGEELFRDKGVAATTVAEITERAGVAKGTFYLYFPTKDHLVAALYEQLCQGMTALVVEALTDLRGELTAEDVPQLIDSLTAAIIDYWIGHRERFLAVHEAGELRDASSHLADYDEEVIALLDAGLRAAVELGAVEVSDTSGAARFIYHGCKGCCMAALLAPGEVDRDGLVRSSRELIRKALAPA